MSLIDELKRRNVFKVGAAYVVVGWLVIQAASIGFPAFDAPPWILRVFILIALLGFPLTLVLAWVFDATPRGIVADSSKAGNRGIFIAAAVLAVLALGWYFYGQPTFRKGDVATPDSASPFTIAVLPFDNMSGDPQQQYFSDGMTEQLLDVLAKVPQLKVVARTSVFQFKNKGGDVRDIGRKLDVANLVEGSVRREANEIRVTAQLVRVSDGFHVWSETYDRKLESVFAVQDDIAQHIASKLTQSLGVAPKVARREPIDPAAYDEFLKGRTLLRQRRDLPTAIAHFRSAIARAPRFAQAWASLSLAEDVIYWYEPLSGAQAQDHIDQSALAAERARELAPDSAETEHVLGNVAREHYDYVSAEQHYLRGISLDPSYPDVREDYSELLVMLGRTQDSLQAARKLVKLDPYFIVGWIRRFYASMGLDERAEAGASLQRIRELDPTSDESKFGDIEYALQRSRTDELRRATAALKAKFPEDGGPAETLLPWVLNQPVVDQGAVDAALKSLPQPEAPQYLAARGDIAGYLAHLDQFGPVARTYMFCDLGYTRPAGWEMLRDSRIKARLREYGFVAYWREKGWPTGCQPVGDDDFECGISPAGG